ncbi:Toxin RTX-I translocation ATP-binding protein [Halomonas sp. THAF12]|nr:Toxin RTX-I translocation ATP-binding protein [Halomonas sp. THAF12]
MTQQTVMDEAQDDASSLGDDELLECLVSVARFYEHDVNRDALTAGLPLEAGRLTPGGFTRAASRAGLAARLVKTRLAWLKPELFPVVLLLDAGRACVLLERDLDSGRAKVIFPDLDDAATDVSLDSLEASYGGRAIYARPRFRPHAPPAGVDRQRGRHWFWGVIRENRRLYRDVIAGSVVINLFALAMPLFVLNVYDRVVPNHATETLWVLAVGVIIVLGFDLILRLLRSRFVDLAASRADVKLSSTLMSQVLGLRLSARPASTGAFASMMQSFEAVRGFIGSATVIGLVDLPFVLMFAAIIALIGPALVLPVLVGILFVLLYAFAAQGKLHELSQTTQEASCQRNATLVESVSQLETLKALRGESRIQGFWEKASAFLSRTNVQLRFISSSVTSVAQWIQHCVAVVIIIIGVYLIVDGQLTQGGLIAAYMLSSRAMAPISQAAALLAQYHQASTALQGLDGIMALPAERDDQAATIDCPVVRGDLTLERVTFRYPDEQRDALRDVSVNIAAGERVAVLGRVGCGKTTLHKLLLGLFAPDAGGVRLDGVDTRQLEPTQLRRHFGYVPQDVILFQGSLRDNILAGAGQQPVDDQALLRAIRLSGLETLVNGHPSGLDLQVGERGQRLSGGQRQQVAIARAMVHDPQIFLLDEPTSAMDHSSEGGLKAHLNEATRGKTTVLITHRTSLLPLVDRIIVFDAGQLVADGPRDQVLEALSSGKIGRAKV